MTKVSPPSLQEIPLLRGKHRKSQGEDSVQADLGVTAGSGFQPTAVQRVLKQSEP